ncbi:hypothetical protein TMatcc_005495 [Talaromyces marneffei ATCC 18224]|uniref:RING-type domain-containing protein n=2 Tax=Talaromyces marneffei TaxID=37727 RepID=B6QAF0_TALMQ|nr:uncharacterized protein EYB26_005964 [Talaromyces marneffei]EEA26246.1 hypothetical protein PMAA_073220 [Talaromyces marneffei ATCC 18224]KAE8554942.1 hypothetical protein EYB25_003489 [Talaromyces marneffei]QGA18280.1 hypothetical protein EYB26_005964 [Talaromyces marneffei]
MSRRSASAVIDLTSSSRSNRHDPNSQQGPAYPPNSNANTTNEPRGTKRRRLDGNDTPGSIYTPHPTEAPSSNDPLQPSSHSEEDHIESVDLTEVNDDSALAKTLAKQREDAIKAQAATENKDGRTTLLAFKCAICMDTPTDATTTVCGHMFCHKCIIDSLRYEEERSEATTGKSNRGKCPACRKLLTRKDTPGQRRDLVPLQFKLKTPS